MSAEALLNGALLGGLYALVALGLSLVFGIMRVVNLAHGIIVLAGAYFAIVITRAVPIDPLLTFVVVGPAVFVMKRSLPGQRERARVDARNAKRKSRQATNPVSLSEHECRRKCGISARARRTA